MTGQADTPDREVTGMVARTIDYPFNVQPGADQRCDRCGAQAWLVVDLRDGRDLLFCVHHYAEHESKLLALDVTIHDHRAHLHAQESGHRDAASAAK